MTKDHQSPSYNAFAAWALDFLLPPSCIHCHMPVSRQGTLCPPCWSRIDFITPPICDRYGVPLPFDPGGQTISAAAAANPPTYARARAVAAYDGVMRTLIHNLKFRDSHEGVDQFTRWLLVAGQEFLPTAEFIVPVPLYWTRLWSRRFNQAALLAKRIAEATGRPYDPFALRRVKRTKSQIGMSAAQRKRNVSGAFQIHRQKKKVIEGRSILLIDDVITTGATVESCTSALLLAGAAQVNVLALARVINRPAYSI